MDPPSAVGLKNVPRMSQVFFRSPVLSQVGEGSSRKGKDGKDLILRETQRHGSPVKLAESMGTMGTMGFAGFALAVPRKVPPGTVVWVRERWVPGCENKSSCLDLRD